MPQHPASRSIDLRIRDRAEQTQHRPDADQRPLVAVRLHQDAARARSASKPRAGMLLICVIRPMMLFERPAGLGDGFGLGAQLALEQRRVVVLDRQDAARLAGDDRSAPARPLVEELDIVSGVGHGLVEQSVGDHRPAAAPQPRRAERDRAAGSPEQLDRRLADLGLEVIRERVGEEQDTASPPDRRPSSQGNAGTAVTSDRRAKAGGTRRRSIPSSFSLSHRAAGSAPSSSTPVPGPIRSAPVRPRGRRPDCARGGHALDNTGAGTRP